MLLDLQDRRTHNVIFSIGSVNVNMSEDHVSATVPCQHVVSTASSLLELLICT